MDQSEFNLMAGWRQGREVALGFSFASDWLINSAKFRSQPLSQINLMDGRLKTSLGPGAPFSKVPKLFGAFSGVKIPLVSQERIGFKSSNFTDMFLLVSLKTS